MTTEKTCDRCGGLGIPDRRCGACGAGFCPFCRNDWCMRDDAYRSSDGCIDGVGFDQCGRYLRAGEMAATWITLDAAKTGTLRFAICMRCYDHALFAGVPRGRFVLGTLKDCITCGYHTAVIDEIRMTR